MSSPSRPFLAFLALAACLFVLPGCRSADEPPPPGTLFADDEPIEDDEGGRLHPSEVERDRDRRDDFRPRRTERSRTENRTW